MPVICNPKPMMMMPAPQVRYFLYWCASCPRPVATAPRVTKTTVNPRINMIECNITVWNNLWSLDFSSSTLAPEIKDMYPGTIGNTHGDRNEAKPARNAAIGNGKEAKEDMYPAYINDL